MRDGLAFAWEPLAALLDDGLDAMVKGHWREVGVHQDAMPVDVDWEKYHDLERSGALRLMGARQDAELVGYSSFIVVPHLHYVTTRHALNDAIYVVPKARGEIGVRLVVEAERALVAEGVRRIVYHAKEHIRLGTGDSLDMIETLVELEAEYGIKIPQDATGDTVGAVLEALGYASFEICYDKMVGD